MKRNLAIALLIGLGVCSPSQAGYVYGQGTWETTLQGRDLNGDGVADAFYDTALNITWLGNTNAGAGSTYDDGPSATDGGMTWQSAVNWTGSLNIGGYDNWRLPNVSPIGSSFVYSFSNNGTTDIGYNITSPSSEMAHMYYVTLGNLGYCTANNASPSSCLEQAGNGLKNTGPLTNLSSFVYWSETEYAPDNNRAWFLGFYNGGQGEAGKFNSGPSGMGYFAWAVHDGDIGELGVWTPPEQPPCPGCEPSPVPLPAAAWLLLSGLGGLGLVARRKAA